MKKVKCLSRPVSLEESFFSLKERIRNDLSNCNVIVADFPSPPRITKMWEDFAITGKIVLPENPTEEEQDHLDMIGGMPRIPEGLSKSVSWEMPSLLFEAYDTRRKVKPRIWKKKLKKYGQIVIKKDGRELIYSL